LGPFILCLAVAANAAAAMILEITAGRLLAPFFGMSLYSWTTVIGVVLAGLTAGHWIGGHLASVSGKGLVRRLSLSFWGGALTSALVLPILSLLIGGGAFENLPTAPAIALSGFAAFFLPSLLAGLVQPLATKLALEMEGGLSGRILGRMLAMGAFGSILGTFLAGFFLISFIGSVGTVWLVVAVNAGLGALFLPGLARALGLAASLLLCGFFAFTPLGGFAFASPCDRESQYFCIQVDAAEEMTGRPSRLLALDHLVHSVNDRDAPRLLASPYLHLVDEIALRRFPAGPASAFFLGGGGFTLPRAWQDRWPKAAFTVAEVDPLVTEVAIDALWFDPAENTRILESDGRVALARSEGRYDVVFGDVFQDIAIPAHLITREFHDLVASRLTPRGFYVLNLIDDPQEPRLLASVLRTLQLTFSTIEIWVTPEDLPGSRRATFVLYAAQDESGLPARLSAIEGYPRTWAQIEVERLQPEILGMLLSDNFAPVDRLLSRFWHSGS
jgi:MFS family permease